MKKLQSTDSKIIQALVLYKAGKQVKDICKELHLDSQILNKFAREAGIKRDHAEAVRKGTSYATIKDDALDILTSDALYWIGFLYADGHIEKTPRTRISITLSEKDKDHLKKFNQFIASGTLDIRDVTGKSRKKNPAPGQKNFDYKYFRIAFSSRKIYDRLTELGFTSNKTLALVPIEILKWSRDFWRGVVDGDGWVYESNTKRSDDKYKYPVIGVSGTEDTNKEFLNFVKLNNINHHSNYRKDKKANVWTIDIQGSIAKAILNLLYKDSTIYLDRKYQKYLELCNQEQLT